MVELVLPVSALVRLVLLRIGWLFASGDERDAEILALRHQVLVLRRHINRPRFTETDRTILAVLSTVFDRGRLRGGVADRATRHGARLAPPTRCPAPDPNHSLATAAHPSRQRSDGSRSVLGRRTRRGDTGACTANCAGSGTGSPHRAFGRSSATVGSTPLRTAPDLLRRSSSVPRAERSSRPTSPVSTP